MAADRLTLARAFEDAGIERSKAETVAGVVFDAIREHVASKADLESAKAELKADIQVVRADMERMEHRLTVRGIGALITGLGILFGALHYWPPQ